MKHAPTKLLATALFFAVSFALLRAQTNAGDTNTTTATNRPPVASTNSPSATSNAVPASSASVHMTGYPQHWGGSPNEGTHQDLGFAKTLVALAGIVIPALVIFGLPVTILGLSFCTQHRRNKMLHETIRSMVEKGMPITPELLEVLNPRGFKVDIQGKLDHSKMRNRNRHLLPGLVLAGIGIALIIALPEHSGPVALIILFVGLAFLIVWLVERKQNVDDERRGSVSANRMSETERKPDNEPQSPKN